MSLEQLKQKIPEYAKDVRLNLSNLFGNVSPSGLREDQLYGMALAVAYSLKDKQLIDVVLTEGNVHLSADVRQAAKLAAILMAMNNVYYRSIHLAENKELSQLSANLRMNGMLNPGISKVDFELYALAVSALNGCGLCIHAHVNQLLEHDVNKTAIQTALRLAAVLNSVVVLLSIES